MTLLESIDNPDDLKRLRADQIPQLAEEIREFLVREVTRTGGHLGPNLGVVELTIALHRVFDSPNDPIFFDTGHQSYVHKLLTGRQEFHDLRQRHGLSGYPSRAESQHDHVENSHASTALSYADGYAKANALQGREDSTAVAVIGDGALTGGMAWEALNNIAAGAAEQRRRIVVVVNDNGRSYSPTIGGLADHLATVRMTQGYEQVLELVKSTLNRTPLVGQPLYDALHGIKKGLKDAIQPQCMFEDLGLKYMGPIDGHDPSAVESALRRARSFGGPVIVHCLTQKGKGHAPAENHEEDQFHAVRAAPAKPAGSAPSRPKWTAVFGEEIVRIGAERSDVVGITAAMLHPTGLSKFAEAYPERIFDVGIAEQHAATSAAGLAMGGMHPVFAVYATFLNRAFDQLLMDVALHRQPVTLVLDRSGVTGPDGPSHHGMWDLSLLQLVPGLAVAVPRDEARLRELLREAVAVDDGPTVLRYPTGQVGAELPAVGRIGTADVLRAAPRERLARQEEPSDSGTVDDSAVERVPAESETVLLVAVGAMAESCCDVADRMAAQGIPVTVVDPRWVKPLDGELVAAAARHRLVAVVEDNGRAGGVGDAMARALRDHGAQVPVQTFGVPQEFLEHGARGELLSELGLDAQHLARRLTEIVASHATPSLEDQQPAR
ncbi:1-deoxy-D-xylulose-5-phosphate synthase [Lipingzhangella sp. LS1_29]|uniref:1-deoxy-D-xylulose-5-phosphate synthase n=1 Tax=Lipingzhangella rawalii TaxID=2055835 RepID=A0ABU2H0L5_9ACTN|nr:1-deoxy-D-xylulose-5-phosphate synthase [Lipingzhangella rawalii]MDS1268842.1 1-deoxy-D-xylulose-5-phosphate synthase [Lipingzhangella rawalii]